jgi:hypothetical protein
MFAEWDSKGGSWQHAGGMLQPPWLFRRKGIPRTTPCSMDFVEWDWLFHDRELCYNKNNPFSGGSL